MLFRSSLLYAWSLQSRVDKGGEYSEGEAGDWTVIYLREQQWCGLRGHGVEWLRTRVPEAVSPGRRGQLLLKPPLLSASFISNRGTSQRDEGRCTNNNAHCILLPPAVMWWLFAILTASAGCSHGMWEKPDAKTQKLWPPAATEA